MARPTQASASRTAQAARKKVVKPESDSEEDGDSSDQSSSEGEEEHVKVAGNRQKLGKTRVHDSEEDEQDDDESDENNEDSQNIAIVASKSKGGRGNGKVNNKASKASTGSTASTNSGASSNSSNGHNARPLAPIQHLQQASPANGGSPAGNPHRSPVRTVSLNDTRRRLSGNGARVFSASDALRRQSLPSSLRKPLVQGADSEADSSFAESTGDAATPVKKPTHPSRRSSTLNAKNLPQPVRRTSAGYALHGGGIGALNAANAIRRHASNTSNGTLDGAPTIPLLSKEAMNTNYEEWMKMATDNKITTSNTWSFALIDYFHNIDILRNPDDEGSINFLKASCTLDGCVKIWTSRVDSVATETGKLLNGLAGDAANAAANADSSGDEGEGGPGEGDGTQRPKKAKRTRAAHATTLADSFAKIQVKELDLEFTVDPLFKKTSADFDEGGAAGLLMNHLSSDSTMRVVFDAGDAKVEQDDEDNDKQAAQEEGNEKIDISKLKAKFLPDLTALADMHICPTFASFKFSSDPNMLDMSLFSRANLEASTASRPEDRQDHNMNGNGAADDLVDAGNAGAPVQDFFDDAGNDFDHGNADGGFGMDMDGGGMMGGHEGYGGGSDSENEGEGQDRQDGYMQAQGAQHALGGVQRFDPRLNPDQREVVIGMGGEEGDKKVFSYFDSTLSKNWAGPEHWKMRKTVRKAAQDEKEEEEQAAGGKKKAAKRPAKEPFKIDFSADTPAPETKKLFVGSNASITLPAVKKQKKRAMQDKREDYLLPDDMHFSSQQLLRLFLKPKAAINMRRRLQRQVPRPGDGEVDEHYWAAAAQAVPLPGGADDDDDDDNDAAPLPFDTQFFHDNDDAPDFEEDLPMGGDEFEGAVDMNNLPDDHADPAAAPTGERKAGDEEDDLLAATQGQIRRARPQFVNYAKKAKRVDVKKLKENIWRELAIDKLPVKKPRRQPDEDSDEEEETEASETISDAKQFTSVISGLRKIYPEEKMEEISTSFCFICLLHLANEEGLRISEAGTATADEPSGSKRRVEDEMETIIKHVGGLDKLRINRDLAV